MKRIARNFDHKKATQSLNHFAIKEGGHINKMKALKLVYLADRYHLRKYGRLISNDIYFAMNYGAVPSSVKDIAEKSEFLGEKEQHYASRYITTTKYLVKSVKFPNNDVFSDSDIEAIDFAWEKFGHLDKYQLAELTHEYPEWSKHMQALKLDSRVQMDLNDFLDDPTTKIEKCFELSDKNRSIRREQLEETSRIESLWS